MQTCLKNCRKWGRPFLTKINIFVSFYKQDFLPEDELADPVLALSIDEDDEVAEDTPEDEKV